MNRNVQSLPEKKGVLCPPGTRVFPGAFFCADGIVASLDRRPRLLADRLESDGFAPAFISYLR